MAHLAAFRAFREERACSQTRRSVACYQPPTSRLLLSPDFAYWDKAREIIDQVIDVMLNYRQSGHPGGSRSKVYPLLTLLLSGTMRWDIRHPEKRFGDRFILGAGHTVPLIYCTLAVLNESLRLKHAQTGDPRYALPWGRENTLFWEDLLKFRRHGGLPGHAEMEGKTLFLKFNTGPSGHGNPAAVGEALALKRAGVGEVKVFFIEGEGGLTPGASHESMNSAWGLALDNLYHIVDWNDYGIDSHLSAVWCTASPQTGTARTVGACSARSTGGLGGDRAHPSDDDGSASPERQPTRPGSRRARVADISNMTTRPTARLTRSIATSTGIPSASSPRNTMWRSPTSAARPPQMPARARPSSRPTCRP
jgi:transketolase N-terminal domain/subunit